MKWVFYITVCVQLAIYYVTKSLLSMLTIYVGVICLTIMSTCQLITSTCLEKSLFIFLYCLLILIWYSNTIVNAAAGPQRSAYHGKSVLAARWRRGHRSTVVMKTIIWQIARFRRLSAPILPDPILLLDRGLIVLESQLCEYIHVHACM
jgi:hypothetical protein